jgi:hypothetical protein
VFVTLSCVQVVVPVAHGESNEQRSLRTSECTLVCMCALGDDRLGTYSSMHNAAVYQESRVLTLGSFLWLGTPGTRGLVVDLPVPFTNNEPHATGIKYR